MVRVCAWCLIRKLKSPFVAELSLFSMLAIVLSIFVSVPSVFSNMIASGDFSGYFLMAFFHTEHLVQSIILTAGMIAIFSLRNFGNVSRLKELMQV